MAVNDTAQLSVQGLVGGENHVHTLHFRAVDALANEQGLIDAWQLNARTAYRAIFKTTDSPVQTITAAQVCGAVPLRAPVVETEAVGNIAGTEGNDISQSLPSFVAAVFSVRTALSGKSRRGRFYIGGLTEGGTDVNMVGGVGNRLQAYITALANNFISPNAASGWVLVVHSRKLAAVPGTQCQDSSTLVTNIILRSQLGTMRSRKVGHGT